jgi:intein/homing endonuclease
VRIGDKVRSHTGAIREVENTFRYDINEPTVCIRAYGDGRGVEMTRDHKVLVVRGEHEEDVRRSRYGANWASDPALRREWVEAGEVRLGDLVCIPRPKPQRAAPHTIDIAPLLTPNRHKFEVEVTASEIIEKTRVNTPFAHSVRSVSVASGVSRNSINHLLSSGAADTGVLYLSNGRRATTSMQARDTLVEYLAGVGFSGLGEWKDYLAHASVTVTRVPRHIPVDEDLMFLLGAVASNGWLRSGDRRRIGVAEQRSTATSRIPDLVKSIFGLETSRRDGAKTDFVQWEVFSTAVRSLFASLLPGYEYAASTKALPDWVSDLDEPLRRSLLDGLWWGDGCTTSKWAYSTSSPTLMRQVRNLLWSVGSSASVAEDNREDSRPEYSNRSKAWKITATPGFDPARLTAQFGFVDDDYVYQRVFRIDESSCDTEVFDIQVAVDHSFMTDSYVVHNSAAGSCLSYCLGIVGIDPIRYDLLFDRFLEPGRVGMPDIDVDFEEARRDEVIAYIADRWGSGMVAKIGTYGVSGSRASLQSAARLLEHPEMARMSTHIPAPGGKALPFAKVLDEDNPAAADFRQAVSELSDAERDVFDDMVALARPMEGTVVNTGIHACGIVLSDEPLIDIVPLRLDTRSKADSGRAGYPITEWEGGTLEGYGLLKMDVLGLRNLDVISRACNSIEQMTGERIDPNNLPDPTDTDDPRVQAAWDLISSGRTAGLFQIESQGMTRVCEDVRPNSLEDLSVVIALFRPGPLAAKMPQLYADRKWGRKPVEYSKYTNDPAEAEAIASVLDNTQACLVYQEQLMMLSTVVAGFDAMWRSKLRQAVGKKKADLMAEAGQKFMADAVREFELPDGTIKPAFRESTAAALWEDFKGSAEYSFNASHSYAYAQLAYITAYLKASWPAAYGAALLSVTKDEEKRLGVLHSLATEGVSVVAPDVNVSQPRTAPVDSENVALGLSEVKGVGDAGRDIVAEREANGAYESVGDLAARNPSVTTTTISALIEAGALDRFGPRRGLFMIHRAAKNRPDLEVPDSDWHPLEEARRQRARLGIVMPEKHPMSHVAEQLSDWVDDNDLLEEDRLSLDRVSQRRDGESVLIFGVVREWVQKVSRAGNLYARFVLEDAHGSVPGVTFARSIQEASRRGHSVTPGDLLCIWGTVSIREVEVPQHDDDIDDGTEAQEAVRERVAEVKARSFMLVDLDQSPTEADSAPADLGALLDLYETGGRQLPDDAGDLIDSEADLPQPVREQPAQEHADDGGDPEPPTSGPEPEGHAGEPAHRPESTVGLAPSGGGAATATLERPKTAPAQTPPPHSPSAAGCRACDGGGSCPRARARAPAHEVRGRPRTAARPGAGDDLAVRRRCGRFDGAPGSGGVMEAMGRRAGRRVDVRQAPGGLRHSHVGPLQHHRRDRPGPERGTGRARRVHLPVDGASDAEERWRPHRRVHPRCGRVGAAGGRRQPGRAQALNCQLQPRTWVLPAR